MSMDTDEAAHDRSRSRKTFPWMPSAVLWHNLPARTRSTNTLGRNLYSRKLRENSDPPPLEARHRLRWQAPFAYLLIASGPGWLLTWHAPWCRSCDCPGAGWRLSLARGYCSALGFELSFPKH